MKLSQNYMCVRKKVKIINQSWYDRNFFDVLLPGPSQSFIGWNSPIVKINDIASDPTTTM